jgi:diguanylate cyclase (GGDEF)-like protein/PAS domain S-box-containing protein
MAIRGDYRWMFETAKGARKSSMQLDPRRKAASLARETRLRTESTATIRLPGPADKRLRDSGFRLLVASIVDYAIYMLDPDGRVVSWNAGAQRMKGYREEEIVGHHFSRFYRREDVERGKPQHGLETALAEGRFEDQGWRLRKDGSTFWANVVITAIRDKANKPVGFAKVTRDMTERQLAMEQIRASEARLQAFMKHSPSVMFIKDLQGRYLHVNDRFTEVFGLKRKDIISHLDSELFPAELAAQFQANDAKALATRAGIEVEEVARYRDGLLHTNIVHKFPLLDSNGQPSALGGVVTDITERKLLEEALRQKNAQLNSAIETQIALRTSQQRLEHVATHDALTGVPNRALLGQRAEHAIALSRRSNRLLALLFIDLDGFKQVNDGLGHIVGDEVLRQVATRFSGCLREVDTLARHGGDEFVVLLEDIEGLQEVEQVTARMQAVLAQPFVINAQRIRVTSSIGVALYPRDGETLSLLLEKSDLAMYRAKELGRNGVQFYTPESGEPGNNGH